MVNVYSVLLQLKNILRRDFVLTPYEKKMFIFQWIILNMVLQTNNLPKYVEHVTRLAFLLLKMLGVAGYSYNKNALITKQKKPNTFLLSPTLFHNIKCMFQ